MQKDTLDTTLKSNLFVMYKHLSMKNVLTLNFVDHSRNSIITYISSQNVSKPFSNNINLTCCCTRCTSMKF